MARQAPPAAPELAFGSHDLRGARLRLISGIVAGIGTSVILNRFFSFGWAVEIVAGWDVGALTTLGLVWWIIARADAKETRRRAAAEDPGRNTAWVFVLVSCTFSLFSAVLLLRRAKALEPEQEALLVILCLVAVISSWVLSHSAYTLRYAHLYYREGEAKEGGIDFPGDDAPDDFDFAYFAFTVGMTFQVSDTNIPSRAIRRAVLGHALLSFTYNTAVVALALNLVAGLVQ